MNSVIHQENRVCRGWVMKGLHGHYTEETENTSFSVIWAFFEYKFYWLIINKNNKYTSYISPFSYQNKKSKRK